MGQSFFFFGFGFGFPPLLFIDISLANSTAHVDPILYHHNNIYGRAFPSKTARAHLAISLKILGNGTSDSSSKVDGGIVISGYNLSTKLLLLVVELG